MAKTLQSYFLVTSIAVSLVLAFFIFRPFLVVLVLAVVFATVLHPLYRGVLRRMSESPGLASFVTILILVICILGPLTFMLIQIVGDAQHLYVSLSGGSGKMYLTTVFSYVNDAVAQYIPGFVFSVPDLSASIDQYIKSGLQWLIQNLGGVFGGAARFFIDLFIFLIALYYLLRDGSKLKQTIVENSPLADADTENVFMRLKLALHAVIRGSLIIALIQGVLTGIGFALFGVPNSILWGMTAVFTALIPGIGTSLVLAPGILYLFISGAAAPATGLLIWSILAVGLIDNFLGPRLVGSGTRLHPLVVFL